MSEVLAEMLSAYHDQELGLEETSRLRRSLAADVGARALVDSFGRTDDAVRESFADNEGMPHAAAMTGVSEIDPNRKIAEVHLALARRIEVDFLPDEILRPALVIEAHGGWPDAFATGQQAEQ